MANWRDCRRSARKIVSKAVSKTGDLSDTASLYFKLARTEAFLADVYEQYGRVAYQKYKTGADVDHKLKILAEKIDIVRAEIYSINSAIKKKKMAREFEEKNAIETEKAVHKSEMNVDN